MRLRILHETAYRYATPANRAIQILRLTPRGYDGQFVANWRIEVDRDCRLAAATDPFGNAVHSFTVDGPLDGLTITATGDIETQDTQGIVSSQIEPLPAGIFLRDTGLTTADPAIREFADAAAAGAGDDRLAVLHTLMRGIRAKLRFVVDATDAGTSAMQAFALGHGVCQDFAHIFIAAARHLGIPARYVSGYLYRSEYTDDQGAGHAWAEALVEGIGWIGFDPANDTCPIESHVRLAVGLDYLGAAPVRGTRYGGAGETLAVRVLVHEAGRGGR
jgi:transglutaminase-like putative cysteine protease